MDVIETDAQDRLTGRLPRPGMHQSAPRTGSHPVQYAMSKFQKLHSVIGALSTKQIFFIGGTMKSGTSWLRLLLDAHPRIACKGEGHVINHLTQLLITSLNTHNQMIAHNNQIVFREMDGFPLYSAEDLAYLVGSALLLAFTKSNCVKDLYAIGEKTPNNVRYFDDLQAVFPTAKFLNVVRDGRDCAVSGWFHNQRTASDQFLTDYPSLSAYATVFAREWANDIACAERFANAHPQAFLTVRYEALLADTPAVLREVLDFLDVSSSDEAIAQCWRANTFEKLSGGRKPGQENRHSFFRNGMQGNWREHLDEAGSRAFAAAAAPWLEQLGYL